MRATPKPLPSVEVLRQTFDYDQMTGILTRKITTGMLKKIATRFGDKPAGGRDSNGYVVVHIGPLRLLAHRVAWKLVHGVDPAEIDHINGDPGDNRIANLREATPAENARNRPGNSGRDLPKGVSRERGRYRAQIVADGRIIFLGQFRTPEAASAAYCAAAERFHGSFARTAP